MAQDLSFLVRHLETHTQLSSEDSAAITSLSFTRRNVAQSEYLVREGEIATTCSVLVSGIAYRQKLTGSGLRQIVSLHFQGEAIDFQNVFLGRADHDVRALTPAVLLTIRKRGLRAAL